MNGGKGKHVCASISIFGGVHNVSKTFVMGQSKWLLQKG